MELTPYLNQLRDDLLAAVALADEETRRAAAAVANALEPSARLALMSALSDLAAEVTGALDAITVDVRLDGRDVRVQVTDHQAPDAEPTPPPTQEKVTEPEDLKRSFDDAAGELSRTTVRLFQDLKSQAESAASAEGVSLNTFISRAVSQSVTGAMPQGWQGRGAWAKGGPAPWGKAGPRRRTEPTRRITGWVQT